MMKQIDIEKLNQLISRTDISGNDKVRWLTDFIDGREFQLAQEKSYSEQDMIDFAYNYTEERKNKAARALTPELLIKQFKKK